LCSRNKRRIHHEIIEAGALGIKVEALSIEIGALNIEVGALNIEVGALSIKSGVLNIKIEALNIEVGVLSIEVGALGIEVGVLSIKVEAFRPGLDSLIVGRFFIGRHGAGLGKVPLVHCLMAEEFYHERHERHEKTACPEMPLRYHASL